MTSLYLYLIRSLRFRLLIGTSIATGIILGLLGFGIYFSIRRSLILDFDAVSLAKAQTLAVTAEQDDKGFEFEFDPRQMPEFSSAVHQPEFFQAWTGDGMVLLRSGSLGSRDLGPITTPASDDRFDGALPDGRAGRYLTYRFFPRPEPDTHVTPNPLWVRLGRQTRDLHHTLGDLRILLLTLCSTAILVTAMVLLWVVNRGLWPARKFARRIETFKETHLSERFDAGAVPPELAPIVTRLNGLLDRLQSAFDQEKAFTSDVAHELRTPLAGLRATLQVCRSRQRQRGAYESAIDASLQITDQITEMVEKLLLLARADAGQLNPRLSVFDLVELIQECYSPLALSASARRLTVAFEVPEHLQINSDRHALRIVLQNLLNNAVGYANEGGSIKINITAAAPLASVQISNTGSQVPPPSVPALTRRFWRGDANRSSTEAHCGLGLSICQRLLTVIDGRMNITSEIGGAFTVELQI